MLIDATHPEETRVVVADGTRVEEFDFESLNKRQLAGNIYLAKVTRVEPSLQAAFVDYGGNRHGFLAFSEIHPDYYQIPVADREAILAEDAENERRAAEEEDEDSKSSGNGRSRRRRRSSGGTSSSAAKRDGDEAGDEVTSADPAEVTEAANAQPEAAQETPAPEAAETTAEAEQAPSDAPQETAPEPTEDAPTASKETAKAAPDDASDEDDDEGGPEEAEDVTDAEDVTEEVRPRRQRVRRYKIQEVIKVRQILLVQVVKEERGNKGAALTTYLSLAGRYCVLMPNTARGGGISRKITLASDRKKLKEIANDLDVQKGAGLIIRTAGAKRTKTEIKRDYEFLIRQWDQVRDLTMKSVAPTLVYEEGSLIKRVIRDLYSREISEILVEGEAGYREAKDYMRMLMPSHAKNVKFYSDGVPLFSRHQVEGYLNGMFNPTVQLKSGGYLVIGITEALVAIDVNSGRSTKEGSIEDTALKTNLEAADEVARQLRLRDLAGLIVIDFIDMDERRNNSAVEKRMKDALKSDRARIQVGRISSFGLMEMSRQRLRPGMIEAVTQPCANCQGTGIVRSADSVALGILRDLQEEGVRQRCKEILVTTSVGVANYIINNKREHIAEIEGRFGIAIRIEADASVQGPDYRMERFKTSSRTIAIVPDDRAVQMHALFAEDDNIPDDVEEAEEADTPTPDAPKADSDDDQPKKKRRRRRGGRRRRKSDEDGNQTDDDTSEDQSDDNSDAEAAAEPDAEASTEDDAPKKRSRSRSRRRKTDDAEAEKPAEATEDNGLGPVIETEPEQTAPVPVPEEEAPKPKRTRARRKPKAAEEKPAEETPAADPAPSEEPAAAEPATQEAAPEPVAAAPEEATPEVAEQAPEAEEQKAPPPDTPVDPAKPKKRGWWNFG
ncbi:ribonuclease E [Rubricella aquisinus]|uniref:Ribonuclease E n=2 Tax=Rubricella aquisinus TaxID=2028108 RepID=A0A840WM80_9RHOB|nr:ribonuclease E [Rubricella aquisinus]